MASSLTTIVLLSEGVYSVNFAIAFTFSLIVAYDAMNVRYQSGEHARYLNELRRNLQNVLEMKETKKPTLKERLGHTPFEVL
ncbi:divergent PAP2 family protein [bacterium]|nr:divergent PAP2 family protein [bacterium]